MPSLANGTILPLQNGSTKKPILKRADEVDDVRRNTSLNVYFVLLTSSILV